MRDYLLTAISFVCIFHSGLAAEECQQNVLGKRETVDVPVGDTLSLSCVVQHCGHTWTGNWIWENSTGGNRSFIKEGQRHHLTNKTISVNQTKLLLEILNVKLQDEGFYGCTLSGKGGVSSEGHKIYMNVTSAVPTQRKILHRVLVCGSSFLCLPIILGLARCLSSEVKPQLLPRAQVENEVVHKDQPTNLVPQPPPRRPVPQKRKTSPHRAPTKPQQNSEVVYAALSQAALVQQGATREHAQSATVYSSVRFKDR